ncbi:hypothetical protein V8F33_001384 [Rhypophila sp. PSN 637]
MPDTHNIPRCWMLITVLWLISFSESMTRLRCRNSINNHYPTVLTSCPGSCHALPTRPYFEPYPPSASSVSAGTFQRPISSSPVPCTGLGRNVKQQGISGAMPR